MKTLVHAIKKCLSSDISCEFFRPQDVYLSIDVAMIPIDAQFPCVGIKDGPIAYDYADGGGCCVTRQVKLIVYEQITAGDEAVTGEVEQLADGILAITDYLREALTDNDLDLNNIEQALPVEETETEIVGSDFLALRKILTIEYKQWEVR